MEKSQLEAALESFLANHDRTLGWAAPASSISADLVFLGKGADALEVLLAQAPAKPTKAAVEHLWKARWNRRAAPVLLVAAYPGAGGVKASVYGLGEDAAFVPEVDLGVAEAIARLGLNSEDSVQAARAVQERLTSLDNEHHGLWNSGLFSTYALTKNAPKLGGWADAGRLAESARTNTGRNLLKALGWATEEIGSSGTLLKSGETHTAVAILLHKTETFERTSSRFNSASPVAHGLTEAKKRGLKWVVVASDSVFRLYSTDPGVGVGRKGETETFTQIDLALLGKNEGAYLPLLFSPEALATGGSVGTLLVSSTEHASSVGNRLRQRVYEHVVPALAQAVARRLDAKTPAQLEDAYHHSMIVLFRLLFIAYAEDGDLLPYRTDTRYRAKSLKQLAQDLSSRMAEGPLTFDSHATDLWDDQVAVWAAIDSGNDDLGVPAYNGGLFRDDAVVRVSGSRLADLRLTNEEFGPPLAALLVDGRELGPVDFRDLSVREFGTIYEGLLESSLSLAESSLIVDKYGSYAPASNGQVPVVEAGQVYLHNASGARKATGSYFTKPFAVDHLLRTSLEPTLREHLNRVRELLTANDDAAAAALFFDFRIADIAMGSGHFLVAAVDHMESIMSAFLVEHPINMVDQELDKLGQSATKNLGTHSGLHEIERASLLRRQIAKRCIYGVDINEIAVELTRVALWIHTFVPGLPMSSLDHSLVFGNSLTGVATLDEALDIFEPQRTPGQFSLFAEPLIHSLEDSRRSLARLGLVSEATIVEAHEAHRLYSEALNDALPAQRLMDAAVAVRLGWIGNESDPEGLAQRVLESGLAERISALHPVHFPVAFPEVFMRERGGFDVILGNPPWDKVRWESAPFWTGVSPGFMALSAPERERRVEILREVYPDIANEERARESARAIERDLFKASYSMGGTHLEYAQLMLERAMQVSAVNGSIGLVLPRQFCVLAGWKRLRTSFLRFDLDLVQGRNKGEWIFDDIHESYAVLLLSAKTAVVNPTLEVSVAESPKDLLHGERETVTLTLQDIQAMSDSLAIPWFNHPDDLEIFNCMRDKFRLADKDGWVVGGHDGRWDFTASGKDHAFAGATTGATDSWRVLMSRNIDAFGLNIEKGFGQIIQDPIGLSSNRKSLGVVERDGILRLSKAHPLIVFRRPSRSDDTRTMIASVLPESGFLPNNGSVHTIRVESDLPQVSLALLGLLNSWTLDWWVRRFVDRHVTAPVVNSLPLPDWNSRQIDAVSNIVSTLLFRSGLEILVGGVATQDDFQDTPDASLKARIEKLVLSGYGIKIGDFSRITSDFSEKGFPKVMLTAFREEGVTL
ncbi:Eco57I restriction-modification methylase domain-containing protein [Arthrobacter sp. AET 35A]|uniref:Eco57I restriction-modification methylase domain-containing protein n=1 Tax=Arthrobacter sp. AET 35A TaxID=2292643 RepID=UPI0017831666|nr:hypothetical protein [Arthrobacter sp. AET 35A]MBE0011196.1 hypothetical protein [Arthrobacter sp. AET 35A]